jgi:tetratricopeptide (TPR) repeat protein
VSSDPGDLWQGLERAANLRELGRTAEATAAYEQLLAHYPDSPEAMLGLASAVLGDDPGRARQLAESTIALLPNNAHAYRIAAYACSDAGAIPDSIRFGFRSVELAPSQPSSHLALADVLVDSNDKRHLARAREATAEAIRLNPGAAGCWYGAARVDLAHNDKWSAEQCLDRALAIDPMHNNARIAKAALDKHDGRLAPAMSVLRSLMVDDPGDAQVKASFDRALNQVLGDMVWAAIALGVIVAITIAALQGGGG